MCRGRQRCQSTLIDSRYKMVTDLVIFVNDVSKTSPKLGRFLDYNFESVMGHICIHDFGPPEFLSVIYGPYLRTLVQLEKLKMDQNRNSNTLYHVIIYSRIIIRVDQNGMHMRHVTDSEPDQKMDPREDNSRNILMTFLHFLMTKMAPCHQQPKN